MDAAPIIQDLVARMPPEFGARALVLSLTTAGSGLFLWFIGARVSRSVFTLVGVAVGTWVGLHLPRWMGWEIDAMATAIGGALALGFAGFLLHMLWVGLTLGTLLAAAGAFIAWHRMAAGTSWSMPMIDLGRPMIDQMRDIWGTLPNGLPRTLPMVVGGCLAVGALTPILLPKLARILTFSLLGTVMLLAGGLTAVAIRWPAWLAQLPTSTQTQGLAIAGILALGAVIQWALYPRMRKPSITLASAAAPNAVKSSKSSSSKSDPAPGQPSRSVWRPRDVRELASTPLGPLKPKEVRA